MNLREYLFKNDITSTKFSNMIGCSGAYLSRIMNGKVVPGKRLIQDIVDLTEGCVAYEEVVDPKSTPKKKRKTKK